MERQKTLNTLNKWHNIFSISPFDLAWEHFAILYPACSPTRGGLEKSHKNTVRQTGKLSGRLLLLLRQQTKAATSWIFMAIYSNLWLAVQKVTKRKHFLDFTLCSQSQIVSQMNNFKISHSINCSWDANKLLRGMLLLLLLCCYSKWKSFLSIESYY